MDHDPSTQPITHERDPWSAWRYEDRDLGDDREWHRQLDDLDDPEWDEHWNALEDDRALPLSGRWHIGHRYVRKLD